MLTRVARQAAPQLWYTAGLIAVEATADSVTIDSPVPVVVDFDGRPPRTLPSGRHEMSVRREN